MLLAFVPLAEVIGIPLSLLGIWLGVLARKSAWRSTALAGIALCGLALFLDVGLLVLFVLLA